MRLEVSLKGNLTTSTKFSKTVKKCLIKIFLRRNLNYIAYDYLCPDMGGYWWLLRPAVLFMFSWHLHL